jgi:hypothetical protein
MVSAQIERLLVGINSFECIIMLLIAYVPIDNIYWLFRTCFDTCVTSSGPVLVTIILPST